MLCTVFCFLMHLSFVIPCSLDVLASVDARPILACHTSPWTSPSSGSPRFSNDTGKVLFPKVNSLFLMIINLSVKAQLLFCFWSNYFYHKIKSVHTFYSLFLFYRIELNLLELEPNRIESVPAHVALPCNSVNVYFLEMERVQILFSRVNVWLLCVYLSILSSTRPSSFYYLKFKLI